MINIAIVEDDKKQTRSLTEYLGAYSAENEGVEFSVKCFNNGIDFIEKYHAIFDVVFMDIEMPLMDGLETARKLRQLDDSVLLVFVTNMAQFALQGYEVEAFDYIVKPIAYRSFAIKLGRILKCLKKKADKKVTVLTENGTKVLSVSSVKWIEVSGHRLYWYTTEGEFSFCGNLTKLETDLSEYGFARCNNYSLVNLQYITDFSEKEVVCAGKAIAISRSKRTEFFNKLSAYLRETQ